MFPKSGYFFKDSDGSIHRSDKGWSSVIARVKAYRKRNGKPPGNPEVEVHAQACQRNPNLCTNESPEQILTTRKVSIKGKLIAWLNKMRANPEKDSLLVVGAEEVKRRSDICAGCPFNTAISETCTPCRKIMNAMRREVVGGRNLDERITGCLVLGEDLPASVWLELQRVDNSELPGHCWRKRG